MNDTIDKKFKDLGEIIKITHSKKICRGNVIKSSFIKLNGSKSIQVNPGNNDEPTIIIHKDGDSIESVEFECKCGRTSRLAFEYDDK